MAIWFVYHFGGSLKGFNAVNAIKGFNAAAMKFPSSGFRCLPIVSQFAPKTPCHPPFVQFLNGHGLSAKDLQFCCLLKSGLSTLELAEIYCVSESAIFKRRQKIKSQLGFESDQRTLDKILRKCK